MKKKIIIVFSFLLFLLPKSVFAISSCSPSVSINSQSPPNGTDYNSSSLTSITYQLSGSGLINGQRRKFRFECPWGINEVESEWSTVSNGKITLTMTTNNYFKLYCIRSSFISPVNVILLDNGQNPICLLNQFTTAYNPPCTLTVSPNSLTSSQNFSIKSSNIPCQLKGKIARDYNNDLRLIFKDQNNIETYTDSISICNPSFTLSKTAPSQLGNYTVSVVDTLNKKTYCASPLVVSLEPGKVTPIQPGQQSASDPCGGAEKDALKSCKQCLGCPNVDDGNPPDQSKCINIGSKSWTALGCVSTDPEGFVGQILPGAIGVGGGIAFLIMLFGIFTVIMSSGNPEKLNQGKEMIVSALAGLLMILFSVFLLKVIGVDILGIPGINK